MSDHAHCWHLAEVLRDRDKVGQPCCHCGARRITDAPEPDDTHGPYIYRRRITTTGATS